MVLRDHMESAPFQGPEDFLFHKNDGSPVDPDVFRSDVLYPALRQLEIPILRRASGFQHVPPLFRIPDYYRVILFGLVIAAERWH